MGLHGSIELLLFSLCTFVSSFTMEIYSHGPIIFVYFASSALLMLSSKVGFLRDHCQPFSLQLFHRTADQ